jgi:DNA polymerase delta subunit 1
MSLVFQALIWQGRDASEDGAPAQYTVDVIGKTSDGRSVCLRVPFFPYFFVRFRSKFERFSTFYERLMKDMSARFRDDWEDGFVKATEVRRKPFFGFTNGRPETFALLVFKTHALCRKVAGILGRQKRDYELYETSIDPVLRLIHVRDLESTGWIQVDRFRELPAEDKKTVCDVEASVESYKDVDKAPIDAIAPIVIASFDIEAYSQDRSFPNPGDPANKIIQIGTTFQRYGETEPYLRTIVCLGETDDAERAETSWYEREADMLIAWAKLLRREKTDMLLGYNIHGFDMNYIWKRITHPQVCTAAQAQEFKLLAGRYRTSPGEFRDTKLSSSAYGNNSFEFYTTPGVYQVDLLTVVRKEFKLDSYKLDSVADTFLGDRKVDLGAREMFDLWEGSPADRKRIADYCIKDTELPLRLVQKLSIIPNLVEMAKATHVPIEFLITRGQQVKCFSQISKLAREEGFLIPSESPMPRDDDTYEGATVLEPETGAYMNPIVTLDFASLYPSIMRRWNLCHSTIVMDKRYDNLPGIEYYECDGVRFAQSPQGILPKLLENLARFRKQAKRQMDEAARRGDKFSEMLYNGKQLAYKVSMNSTYGFCGASNGFLPCKPIASTVTTTGRKMIEHTKRLVEEKYPGARVRYGDSVSGTMECALRLDEDVHFRVEIQLIASMFGLDRWERCYGDSDKESCELTCPLECWTERGWTRVHRVIRHRLPRGTLVRVRTADGSYVEVTEDHSLLLSDGTPITPRRLRIGDVLLVHSPDGRPADGRVVSMREVPLTDPDQYVYDLTTENHHFQAGYGNIIVHNTDSVFIDFGDIDLREAFRLGEEAAAYVTSTFQQPIAIEFEKAICPMLLFSKKRYAGLMYEGSPDTPKKVLLKGVQLVRRDSCPYVKRVCKEALDRVLYKRDLKGAVEVVRAAVRDLLEGRAPIEELTLSKALAAGAEDLIMDVQGVCKACHGKTMELHKGELTCSNARCGAVRKPVYKQMSQAHITVACKLEERNPGSGPRSNDRVPFVYVEGPKALNASERAEDPKFVQEHGIQVDTMYYFNNGLVNVAMQLFEELLPKGSDAYDILFDRGFIQEFQEKHEKHWKALDRRHKNAQKKQKEITAFFGPAV